MFKVKKENGEGRIRTLHRNVLLPISSVPTIDIDTEASQKTKEQDRTEHLDEVSEDDSSSSTDREIDSDDSYVDVTPQAICPSVPSSTTERTVAVASIDGPEPTDDDQDGVAEAGDVGNIGDDHASIEDDDISTSLSDPAPPDGVLVSVNDAA